jgi:hypothetical protein
MCRECVAELKREEQEAEDRLFTDFEDDDCETLDDDEREGDVEERGTQRPSIALPGIDRQGVLM